MFPRWRPTSGGWRRLLPAPRSRSSFAVWVRSAARGDGSQSSPAPGRSTIPSALSLRSPFGRIRIGVGVASLARSIGGGAVAKPGERVRDARSARAGPGFGGPPSGGRDSEEGCVVTGAASEAMGEVTVVLLGIAGAVVGDVVGSSPRGCAAAAASSCPAGREPSSSSATAIPAPKASGATSSSPRSGGGAVRTTGAAEDGTSSESRIQERRASTQSRDDAEPGSRAPLRESARSRSTAALSLVLITSPISRVPAGQDPELCSSRFVDATGIALPHRNPPRRVTIGVVPAVTAEVGALVSRNAHAIVHPATPRVTFGGVHGRAIRDVCGGESFERLVQNALDGEFDTWLDTGDCLVTTAGAAKGFRWVLHVPATDGDSVDPETGGASGPTRICDCTFAFLDHAAELARSEGLAGKLVVASALLGVGAPGVDPALSARAMVAALRDFLRSSQASALRTIQLVASSDAEAAILRAALE